MRKKAISDILAFLLLCVSCFTLGHQTYAQVNPPDSLITLHEVSLDTLEIRHWKTYWWEMKIDNTPNLETFVVNDADSLLYLNYSDETFHEYFVKYWLKSRSIEYQALKISAVDASRLSLDSLLLHTMRVNQSASMLQVDRRILEVLEQDCLASTEWYKLAHKVNSLAASLNYLLAIKFQHRYYQVKFILDN